MSGKRKKNTRDRKKQEAIQCIPRTRAIVLQLLVVALAAATIVFATRMQLQAGGACAGLLVACGAGYKWLTRCPRCGSMAHRGFPWSRSAFRCPKCGAELQFSDDTGEKA
ncbi:MAG: hypothetical protein ACI3XZ_02965 [Butyricicoccus sp.]